MSYNLTGQTVKGAAFMNIYDISEKAGVSIATVSRVLNGSSKVSEATRKKVLDVMEQNGYTPNAFARSLGLNSMHTVGILCSDASDVYQAQAVYYLERELRNNSYASMLCCTGYLLEEKQRYLDLLLSRSVDAVLFIGSRFVEESESENSYILDAARRIPVFILNGELKGENIYSVLCDDRQSSRDITDLILSRGSTSPVYLYRALTYSGKRKIEGFKAACAEHGLTGGEKRIFSSPGDVHKTRSVLEQIRESGLDFDAVIAADDELAAGAVKYAYSRRLTIPSQFQIGGYNNSVLASCSTPEITTVDNRVEFMCTTAVALLMQVFEGRDIPSKTMFSGTVVEKSTTLR